MIDIDNDNGCTPAQESAERAFKAASEQMAEAWPLPAVPFLTGMSGGERHAIDREWYDRTRRHYGGSYTRGECGRPVLYASQYPVWAGDWPPHARLCPVCAWTVAAREGDLDRQVRALTPSADDQRVLGRLMGDPLIAVKAAMSIIEAAERDHRYRIGPETILLLAAVTRHRPAVLLAEECSEGGCEHGRRGDGSRSCGASAACEACSVQAGPEAGELEGMFLGACTIPAPCAPLTALAVHAEREHAEFKRREQQLAGTTIAGGELPVTQKPITPFSRELGRRLRAERTARGLSLNGVHVESGGRWSGQLVGAWERGDRTVSAANLVELARFYGIPVEELLRGIPDPALGADAPELAGVSS